MHKAKAPRAAGLLTYPHKILDVKRGAATACALHVGVLELEPSAFQGLDIIDMRSAQLHQRGRIDVYYQTFKVENFVHHASAILEGHGVLESGASAADYPQPQPGG